MVKVTIQLPQVGRKKLIVAGVLCSTAATLWIYAAAQRSALAALPLHIMVGVGVPFGVGFVTLLLIERRIARELAQKRAARRARQAAVKEPEGALR